jgi:hypothetical protein
MKNHRARLFNRMPSPAFTGLLNVRVHSISHDVTDDQIDDEAETPDLMTSGRPHSGNERPKGRHLEKRSRGFGRFFRDPGGERGYLHIFKPRCILATHEEILSVSAIRMFEIENCQFCGVQFRKSDSSKHMFMFCNFVYDVGFAFFISHFWPKDFGSDSSIADAGLACW